MVPYRYDRPQPTELLWVSEGITDYYADLALVRSGIIDSTVFLNVTLGKIAEVADLPPVALEDASLSTWINPTDGTHTIYYPKGSLAGLLLDILIRDASDNRRSLDDVMRRLYQSADKQQRGFTTEDWWRAVEEAAGGRPFAEFASRYIDGREPFPWASVAPLAGLRYVADTVSEPRIGVATVDQDGGQTVTAVVPGSAAAEAGVAPGDRLVRVGSIEVDASFGLAFRSAYRTRIGETVPMVVRRDGRDVTLQLPVRGGIRIEEHLEFDRRAPLKAVRIRHGILTGGGER
jgi:predicted metalloprotease with PDZ domain